MTRLYTYIVAKDSGFAPNPFWRLCTLAHCTPNHMNAQLQEGDMYRRNVKKWALPAMPEDTPPPGFPTDPLENVNADIDTKRLSVQGILESYHSNYDALSEAIQNAVDAVEDAKLEGLPEPYLIEVTISLAGNWISVLDTGLGMTLDQVKGAFAPQVTYKQQSKRDQKTLYRGY